MYYRFEIWLEGEPAGVGFLQGLDDIGLDDDKVDQLISPFDMELPYPPDDVLEEGWTKSWFTEEGYDHFRSAIDAVCAAYWETDMWEAVRIAQDDVDDIVYQDQFQIVQRVS
jgi:hypothetical protein